MELYTFKLIPNTPTIPGIFIIQDIIEEFESLIWTERYYGDSEVEVILPLKAELIQKFPLGTFLNIEESNELLIVETVSIENNRLKIGGISILSWLNNRFVRASQSHKARAYKIETLPPGQILYQMMFDAINSNSEFLVSSSMDIPSEWIAKLPIPEIGLYNYDASDDPITLSIPFGPLYDAMRDIATSYQIGMRIRFEAKLHSDAITPLGFESYKGVNKTRTQDPDAPQNPIVRFSADLDSLENLRELQSNSLYKTLAVAYAPNLDEDIGGDGANNAGVAFVDGTDTPGTFYGFNCRALQVFAEDLTQASPVGTDDGPLFNIVLTAYAKNALEQSILIQVVDGDISPTNMFQYGRDYKLGDIVELESSDGTFSAIRVTEHIISEDATGEKNNITYGRDSDNNTDITP